MHQVVILTIQKLHSFVHLELSAKFYTKCVVVHVTKDN